MGKTVNAKGSVGVARVVADMIERGYEAFLPFDGSSSVDLVVADTAMNLRRLQVKYRTPNRSGSLDVYLSSVVNGKRKKMDIGRIDGWAIFCPDTDTVYYVPKNKVQAAACFSLALRKMKGAVRMADDFLSPEALWG